MSDYDVIVLGARVAGSPTAMLLARMGYRVLLVDRATFPSDTISTHLIHPPGMAALHRWGLADQVIATECPPVSAYRLDFGPLALAGAPRGLPGAPYAYAPRRFLLDKILIDAAAQAGAEIREGFSVETLIMEDGIVRGIRGHTREGARLNQERARMVVGADGTNSMVARSVGAARYNEIPALQAMYYSYWTGVPADGEFQTYVRDNRALVALPTNDDLTIVLVAWPIEEFEANKRDLEASYLNSFDADPTFAGRLRGATRESRIVGTRMDNFYRRSYGPGWALVGDAGYHKDACTAQGISDAFRDAELLTQALDDALSGRRPYGEALASYQHARDELTRPVYELTCDFASWEPPPPDQQELFAALSGNQEAMDDFMSMIAGTVPVQQFFDPANIERYLANVV
jgi:flavin-dependent dehydrogenase